MERRRTEEEGGVEKKGRGRKYMQCRGRERTQEEIKEDVVRENWRKGQARGREKKRRDRNWEPEDQGEEEEMDRRTMSGEDGDT